MENFFLGLTDFVSCVLGIPTPPQESLMRNLGRILFVIILMLFLYGVGKIMTS